jgi:hypothetical protein
MEIRKITQKQLVLHHHCALGMVNAAFAAHKETLLADPMAGGSEQMKPSSGP